MPEWFTSDDAEVLCGDQAVYSKMIHQNISEDDLWNMQLYLQYGRELV